MSKKRKVCVIGPYSELGCGQTVKTITIHNYLTDNLQNSRIKKVNTSFWAKRFLICLFKMFVGLLNSNCAVILLANNGIVFFCRFFLPFYLALKKQVHYVVIGGWLPEFLKKRPTLAKRLKKFDGIYVETNKMKKLLEDQGFQNIFLMPNCKKIRILEEDELIYHKQEPYPLCTFSRVMKEKGIEDAVAAVKAINSKCGRIVYTLDIYGQIEETQTDWFSALEKDFPSYIRYGGCVPFDRSVDVLKNYFALLFPTHFYTEGIPGTIIDSYTAGVPVISAEWENVSDMIEDGKTGLGYPFNAGGGLEEKLTWISDHVADWNQMKNNCLEKAREYQPQTALNVLVSKLT